MSVSRDGPIGNLYQGEVHKTEIATNGSNSVARVISASHFVAYITMRSLYASTCLAAQHRTATQRNATHWVWTNLRSTTTQNSPVDDNAGSNGVGDAAEFESFVATTTDVGERSSERGREPVLDLFRHDVAVSHFTQLLVLVVQSTAAFHTNFFLYPTFKNHSKFPPVF